MKVRSSLVFTLLALSLAACSSGGGGSDSGNGSYSGSFSYNGNLGGGWKLSVNYPDYSNSNPSVTKAVATDGTLYSATHSWKVTPPSSELNPQLGEVMVETNKLRAEKGLPPLQYDARLSAYAQRRAEETARNFEHARQNGQSIWTGLEGGGWRGENLAAGNDTAVKTVLQWRNSEGHYKNIINQNFTKMGVGVVYVPNSKYKYYWVQIFGDGDVSSNYYFATNIAATGNDHPRTTLLVDGVSIPLSDGDLNGQWKDIRTTNYQGKYSGYAYTRFGVLNNKDNSSRLYQTFYQGDTPTANMPQNGTARYVGTAAWVNNGRVETGLNSQFSVDFGNKNLSGKISDNANNAVNLQANITGNTFHSAIGADVETHGGFFGSNADELAGDFREQAGSGKIGAFGAKRQ